MNNLFHFIWKDAILLHVLRSVFQAGIWTTSEHSIRADSGISWEVLVEKEDGAWVPKWKHPRGVKGMQRAHLVHLQRSMHKMQVFQGVVGMYTTL